jgi:hypothetical protein
MTEFWSEFLSIFTDPAHMAVEVLNTFIIDVVVLGFLWPFITRRIRREHRTIDREHGVSHLEEWQSKVLDAFKEGDQSSWRADLQPPYPEDYPVPYVLTDKGKATAPGV